MKWLIIFIQAYNKAFNMQNIKKDFHNIKIHLFLSIKILNRVLSSIISQVQSQYSIISLSSIIISFNDIILINSSIDKNIIWIINMIFNNFITFRNSFTILVKKYVSYLIRNSEYLHTLNIIL